MPQSKPRKPIADLIEELKSWLPNYDHGPTDYPTLLWRILASLPGGDRAEDMGYETFQLGWQEVTQLGDVLAAIQDQRDVSDLIDGLVGDEEEGVEESRRRQARAARSYPYDRSPSDQYVLTRDGKEVTRGTEQQVWAWMHRNVSSSVDHALKHEGYRITPVEGGAREPVRARATGNWGPGKWFPSEARREHPMARDRRPTAPARPSARRPPPRRK